MPVKLRYFLSGECSSFSPALTDRQLAETGLEKAEKRYAQAKARLQSIRNREATKRRKGAR